MRASVMLQMCAALQMVMRTATVMLEMVVPMRAVVMRGVASASMTAGHG